jgi:hypothetical protein
MLVTKLNPILLSFEDNKAFVKGLRSVDLTSRLTQFKKLNHHQNSMPTYIDLVNSQSISSILLNVLTSDDARVQGLYPNLPTLLPQIMVHLKPVAIESHTQDNVSGSSQKEGLSSIRGDPDAISSFHKLSTHIMPNPIKSDINLHTDLQAQNLMRSLGVDAMTFGRDIYFAKGMYDPTTPSGIALIAHELTHVKQQEKYSTASNWISPTTYTSLEKEAIKNERKVFNFFYKYSGFLRFNSNDLKLLDNYLFSPPINDSFALHSKKRQNENIALAYRHLLGEIGVEDYGYLFHTPTSSQSSSSANTKNIVNFLDPVNSDKENLANTSRYEKSIMERGRTGPELQLESRDSTLAKDPPTFTYYTANVPQIRNQNGAIPFFAESGRPVSNESSESPSFPSTALASQLNAISHANVNVDLIAVKVYEIIERKIKMQREQRGLR